jgi:hypothetical protein
MQMKKRFNLLLSGLIIAVFFSSFSSQIFAQSAYENDLRDYIRKLHADYGADYILKERFLLSMIKLTNDQLAAKIGNVGQARKNYFQSLLDIQREVKLLRPQLGGPGSFLYETAEQLEDDIDEVIDYGVINHSRKAAFEDALEMLVLASQNPGADIPQAEGREKAALQIQQMRKALGGDKQSEYAAAVNRGEITLYTLYKEWKKLKKYDQYKMQTELRLIRNDILRDYNTAKKSAMVANELSYAYRAFNLRNYRLAGQILEEILYSFPNLEPRDDVLYYIGESYFAIGMMERAMRAGYEPLIAKYPSSNYYANALVRGVQKTYNEKKFEECVGLAGRFESVSSAIHKNNDDVFLLAGVANARLNRYNDAIAYFEKLTNKSRYYFLGQILIANLKVVQGNFVDGEAIYRRMVGAKNVPVKYRDMAVANWGIAKFQNQDYDGSTYILNQLSKTYPNYDMAIMALVWSGYKKNIALPEEQRDFTLTKKYAREVMYDMFGSEYELEAKSLYAQIVELEGNVDDAIIQYKNIEKYLGYKQAAEEYIDEREKYKDLQNTSRRVKEKALRGENLSAYEKAQKLEKSAGNAYTRMNYSDLSSFGSKFARELSELNNQVKKAEALRDQAKSSGNKELEERAETLLLRLYRMLNKMAVQTDSKFGFNYFDGVPVAKLEAEKEQQNASIQKSREYLDSEKVALLAKRKNLIAEIEQAKRKNDYKKVILTEILLEDVNNILGKMDQLSTLAYSNEVKDVRSNVREWADFGAFGVVNTNIMQKEKFATAQTRYAEKLDEITKIIEARKTNIDNLVFRIEEEITLMTRKVKEQRRRREREEKFREFEESYFDRRESETAPESSSSEIKDQVPGSEGPATIQDVAPEVKDEPIVPDEQIAPGEAEKTDDKGEEKPPEEIETDGQ